MTDAISRSAVLKRIYSYAEQVHCRGEIELANGVLKAMCVVEDAPAIDAVPVVRCKDCVHAAPLEGYASRKFEIGLNCRACRGDSGYGIVGLSFTVPDGYCDDGLRRAGEAE